MGWASSRPNNSHLTTPTWAAAVCGLVLLNVALLMALLAIGPLDCDSTTSTAGGDPRRPQEMRTKLNCDPGVTPQEQATVGRLAFLGVGLVMAGFILGTIELTGRAIRNMRSDSSRPMRGEVRRD